jgi:biopolymer transport protein ExbD
VLVPFLLSTAVFTRLSVIDLSLPAQVNEKLEKLTANNLQLEIVVRREALEVGDRIGGLIQRIPATATGPDLRTLQVLVQQIKQKFPDKRDATVLAEAETSYDTLVQVMDAVRAGNTAQGGTKVVKADLFPDISIGDAPLISAVVAKK